MTISFRVTSFTLMNAFAQGDFAYLADLVRNDVEMTPQVRQHLADLLLNMLTGKWKRPAKRPAAVDSYYKAESITACVRKLEAEGWPRTAAIARAAELHGCSTRWVASTLKRCSEEVWGKCLPWGAHADFEIIDETAWRAFVKNLEAK